MPAFNTMSITSLTRMDAQIWAASSRLPPMSDEKPCTEAHLSLEPGVGGAMCRPFRVRPPSLSWPSWIVKLMELN